jgi:conjugal transfer pilus assembly protein TraF
MIRPFFVFAFVAMLSWTTLGAAAPDDATTTSDATEVETRLPSYWRRNREGWFWYQDPPPEVRNKKETSREQDQRPRELVEFEAMQKRLDELKRIAVMNPSESHMKAYMGYQRYVMDKSAVFADNWQRVVWKTPELDYSLTGRPTNSFAIDVFDGQLRDKQTDTIRALAKTHGLFFFFRSDCPYCHKFAPVLRHFERDYGLTVFAVSLDGGGLPEYPTPLTDNGMAANLNVRMVPAVFLAVPGTREITPIGYGVMAETELVERIHAIMQTKTGQPF